MKRFIFILPFLAIVGITSAPACAYAVNSGSLTGTVVTPQGRGLVGAVVALFKQDDQGAVISLTRSDDRGTYSLNDILPGSYALRVSRYGYQVLTSSRVTINPGRTTTVNVVLQEFLDFISASSDPRNWDLKTVMRSTSDRRLIFRDLPGTVSGEERGASFRRAGTLNVASSSLLGKDNGIVSNFAYTEPVSMHGRMVFSGQFTSGYDSLWRVRDTYQYRPDKGRDYKLSVGYGRLNLNRMSAGTMARPSDFFNQDPAVRDSGIETLAMGFEASNQFLNTFAVSYGMDMSRVNYGVARNFWSPYFQVLVTPHHGWLMRTMMTSRRVSENNSVELPDGDIVSLMEPVSISKINDTVQLSQIRHSEFSVARKLDEDTSLEVTVYKDRVDGPGTPFVMSFDTSNGKSAQVSQLRGDQDNQQGLRVAVARMLLDSVRGAVTYSYGSAAGYVAPDDLMPSAYVAAHLLDSIQRSYYHSFTGQLEAKIPQTHTNLQATLRWYPGNPISTIDQFADRLDTFTKGMSFSLRQAIPLPEFLGPAGRWEALIDVRNPFDQGRNCILTSDGELTLTRNPRTLRFGLNLNFF